MRQTTEAEIRTEAARPHFIRAIETTLDVQRERLFHDLGRAQTEFDRELVREKIRDLARLIQNGITPLADHVFSDGTDTAFKYRLGRLLDDLYEAAHPKGSLPLPPKDDAVASALITLATKIDALAIGVALMNRKGGK